MASLYAERNREKAKEQERETKRLRKLKCLSKNLKEKIRESKKSNLHILLSAQIKLIILLYYVYSSNFPGKIFYCNIERDSGEFSDNNTNGINVD